jgi:hypothetical protein
MSRACVDDDELQAYLERQLAPAARDDLEAHVAACPDCRTLLAATARALGGDGDDDRADDTVARTAPTHPLPPPVPGVPVRLPTVPYEAYVVDGEIARGGLGRVLRATDLRLGRTVALKVLLPGRERAEARFVHEAHITAGLEHPAIVPVHEAGRWPDGEPFYAMKLVSGQTLTDRIKQARTLGDRLALLPGVLRVVEAVAYAHSHGVIHRDLKPANVLCGQFGETVVIDWGLAKQLGAGEVPGPLAHIPDTKTGVVLGTPPYMPPEQARGEVVDGQADVYALGAILYELLSGSPPYAEAGKQVLDAVVAGPPRPLESLQEGVPRDLLAIVRKAMARDRAARYPTAGELAADLAHFQTGQLVSAREYSRWALWVRWLRRHRLPVAVAAAALIVVGTLAAISLSRVVHARAVAEDARAAEEQARRQAEARQHELVRLQARAIVDRDPTRALAWLAQIPATAPGWDEVRAVVIDAVSRGYARHVWRVDDKHTSIAFAPDGRWLISAGHGPMRVADPAGGRARALALPGGAFEAAFAADGTMAASGEDGTIAIYPPASIAGGDAVVRVLRQGGAPAVRTFIAIAPDGRTVATATDRNGDVTLWDVATGDARTFTGPADGARDLRFSPDGRTVATITIDRVLRLRDVATGAARELVGKDVASNFVFTADGTRALVAELSGIREWTLATGASRLLPLPRQGYITVAASADGATIAAAGFEGPIHLLDVASGQITTLGGHEALVVGLAFAPDGRTLASIAMDLTIRVWQRPTRRDRVLATVAGTAASPVFAPDGRTVAVGAGDGRVWLVPVDGVRRRLRARRPHAGDPGARSHRARVGSRARREPGDRADRGVGRLRPPRLQPRRRAARGQPRSRDARGDRDRHRRAGVHVRRRRLQPRPRLHPRRRGDRLHRRSPGAARRARRLRRPSAPRARRRQVGLRDRDRSRRPLRRLRLRRRHRRPLRSGGRHRPPPARARLRRHRRGVRPRPPAARHRLGRSHPAAVGHRRRRRPRAARPRVDRHQRAGVARRRRARLHRPRSGDPPVGRRLGRRHRAARPPRARAGGGVLARRRLAGLRQRRRHRAAVVGRSAPGHPDRRRRARGLDRGGDHRPHRRRCSGGEPVRRPARRPRAAIGPRSAGGGSIGSSVKRTSSIT